MSGVKTERKSALGCWNRPQAGRSTWVQDGYRFERCYGERVRLPRMVEIPMDFKKDVPCGYLERLACKDCEGCRWREWIEAAAIRTDDGKVHSVPRPGQHADVLADMHAGGWRPKVGGLVEQGFLLRGGRFVDRKEVRAIAINNGQCSAPAHAEFLFSEDLW